MNYHVIGVDTSVVRRYTRRTNTLDAHLADPAPHGCKSQDDPDLKSGSECLL